MIVGLSATQAPALCWRVAAEENMAPEPSNTIKHCELEVSIGEIGHLNRSACLDRWREVFGHPPPKYVSMGFVKRGLIWSLQCGVLGGVPKSTERTLRRIAIGTTTRVTAKPGSRLVRDWNGRTLSSRGYR